MKIQRKNDFLKGIITKGERVICNKCKKIFQISEDIYKDGSRIDYDLCKKCYFKEINNLGGD